MVFKELFMWIWMRFWVSEGFVRLLREHESLHTVKSMCLLISQALMHKDATLLFKSNLCGFYLLSHAFSYFCGTSFLWLDIHLLYLNELFLHLIEEYFHEDHCWQKTCNSFSTLYSQLWASIQTNSKWM